MNIFIYSYIIDIDMPASNKGVVKGHMLPSSQNPPSELALLQQELTKMSALIKSLKESQRASQRALSAIYRRQNPPLEKPQSALSAIHHQLKPQSALSAIKHQLKPQRKNRSPLNRLIERLKTQQYKKN